MLYVPPSPKQVLHDRSQTHPYANPLRGVPYRRAGVVHRWCCGACCDVGGAMKRSIRRIRRVFGGHFWKLQTAFEPVYADQVVTDEEIQKFIANIAATGFYDDAAGNLVPASRERRDWIERDTDMDPVARTEFFNWARDTAQSTMYGALAPSTHADQPSAIKSHKE
jgi:hypothetical protein